MNCCFQELFTYYLSFVKSVFEVNLLCIGLFQQRTPELISGFRMTENEFSVLCRKSVVDNNVDPLTKPPERKPEDTGIFRFL